MDNAKEFMKEVAVCFYIKCSKYEKEQLTSALIDLLYEEAFDEACTRMKVNNAVA